MAVYQTSGVSLNVYEGNPGYLPADVINNITGGQGAKYLRVLNSSTANVSTLSWTLDSQVYTFTGVSGSTPGGNTSATFVVTITGNGQGGGTYSVSILTPGENYPPQVPITILGDVIGGATPANDLTFYAIEVSDEDGSLIEIGLQGGTPEWPPLNEVPTGVTNLLPKGEVVVQVVPGSTTSTGISISTTGAGTDLVYVEAVTIVG